MSAASIERVLWVAFAAFMLAPETQAVIKTFGVARYGQALFVPIAGKKDEDF